jgi:hypothetical protein
LIGNQIGDEKIKLLLEDIYGKNEQKHTKIHQLKQKWQK